jgi:nitroimidazol reductase NimA-like FMN-containing flavoprotein (pyridoxamine 5'-phosphate oxidase superfamily)
MIQVNELGRDECLRLLAGQKVGRLLLVEDAVPIAQPVNYVLDGEEVVFATGSRRKRRAAERQRTLGFQIDHVDSDSHCGWSVLGGGEAYEITAPLRLAQLDRAMGDSWVPGAVGHVIAIPLRILQGRRLALAEFVSDGMCGLPL